MMSCIGAAYGTKILSHIIIISSIMILVYYIIMKIQKKQSEQYLTHRS